MKIKKGDMCVIKNSSPATSFMVGAFCTTISDPYISATVIGKTIDIEIRKEYVTKLIRLLDDNGFRLSRHGDTWLPIAVSCLMKIDPTMEVRGMEISLENTSFRKSNGYKKFV